MLTDKDIRQRYQKKPKIPEKKKKKRKLHVNITDLHRHRNPQTKY